MHPTEVWDNIQDKELVHGKLTNGLSYYVCSNREPTSTVYVSLIVRVGSYVEEEYERGLAHLLERLAFQATDCYRVEVAEYLSRFKATTSFGSSMSAYTSVDRTVYAVPIQGQRDLSLALAILADFSSKVRVTDQILDLERQVVLSEYECTHFGSSLQLNFHALERTKTYPAI